MQGGGDGTVSLEGPKRAVQLAEAKVRASSAEEEKRHSAAEEAAAVVVKALAHVDQAKEAVEALSKQACDAKEAMASEEAGEVKLEPECVNDSQQSAEDAQQEEVLRQQLQHSLSVAGGAEDVLRRLHARTTGAVSGAEERA